MGGNGIKINPGNVMRFGGVVQSTARGIRRSSSDASGISVKVEGLASGDGLDKLVRNWSRNTDIMADNINRSGSNITRAAKGWTVHDITEATDYR